MAPEDERKSIWAAVGLNSDRITALEAIVKDRDESMREIIREAVRAAMPKALLTDEEHGWVKLAIQREAQMSAFRRAVIEKSFIGLVWAGILGIGIMIREYAIAHGVWRP